MLRLLKQYKYVGFAVYMALYWRGCKGFTFLAHPVWFHGLFLSGLVDVRDGGGVYVGDELRQLR